MLWLEDKLRFPNFQQDHGMAPQLAAVRDSRAKQVGRWLRDRVYPTLDPPARNLLGDAEKPKREINAGC